MFFEWLLFWKVWLFCWWFGYWDLDDCCHTPHLIYPLHFALLYRQLELKCVILWLSTLAAILCIWNFENSASNTFNYFKENYKEQTVTSYIVLCPYCVLWISHIKRHIFPVLKDVRSKKLVALHLTHKAIQLCCCTIYVLTKQEHGAL